MFAHASPTTSPTVTATGSTTTPVAAPPRQSRLRGLSYLRNYTQTHLSSLHHHSNNSASSPSESPTNSGNRGSPSPIHLSSSHSRDLNSSYFPPIEETSNTARSTGSQAAGSEASGEDRHTRMARKKPGIAASLSSQTEQTTRRGQSGPTASSSSQTTRSYLRLFTGPTNNPPTVPEPASDPAPSSAGRVGLPADQMPTIRFIPHQDPRSNKPSLIFTATSRTLPHEDCVIRVGRYSERDIPQTNPPPNVPSSAPVGFKSKVVSRRHCEFWCSQGQWYIKDVRSSSGTFLNHIRLSQPSSESKPFPVNDGDIIQLGIDFRGGEEPIFRCVKIRIECNRAWQKGLNTFNTSTHKRLAGLGKKVGNDASSTHSTECSICLMSVAPCQSLFVAPCSHVWHFKCIRPLLNDHRTYPQFMCPNCRATCDLEAETDDVDWDVVEDEEGSNANNDLPPPNGQTVDTPPSSAAEQDLVDITSGMRLTSDPPNSVTPEISNVLRRSGTTNSSGEPVPLSTSTTFGDRLASPVENDTIAEGPITPRNDAGPFIFDGGAPRNVSGRSADANEVTVLN